MLESLDPKKARGTAEQANGIILSLTEPDRITYVCVVDRQISSTAGYSFLDDLKAKWRARYGNSAGSFAPNSKTTEFGPEIAAVMRNYNSQSYQKVNQIQSNLTSAQNQMTQNLTMALIRGEPLSNLEAKAEEICGSAQAFKMEVKALKCQQLCARIRWWILGIGVLLVVIVIILLVVCGVKFEKCPEPTAAPAPNPTAQGGG
jgi:hypothetical protein